jgi:hypothetical protein
MKVMFSKSDDGRLCSWRAEPPGRRAFQGSTMASRAARTDLPHDLAQFVVEARLGLDHGFWNLLANGATFKSVERRRTRPGRQLILAHRGELNAAEWAVNTHVHAWRVGRPTPAESTLDAMLARWRSLPVGEELVVEWPTRRLTQPRRRNAPPSRRPRRRSPPFAERA